jgi:hypothetical protein
MKYTREEYNEKLLLELEYSQAKGQMSEDLKLLCFNIANDISLNRERYPFIDEDMRVMCVVFAYEACTRYVMKFNREKSDNAYSYVSVIIRSSFAGTLKKQYDRKHKSISL